MLLGAHGSVVGCSTMGQAGWSQVLFLIRSLKFLSRPIIFSPSMALGFTQPITKIKIRRRKIMFLGNRARPVHKANNLTANCEPTV
jgi:hypothetical protein